MCESKRGKDQEEKNEGTHIMQGPYEVVQILIINPHFAAQMVF
jgi:hypothetical protein